MQPPLTRSSPPRPHCWCAGPGVLKKLTFSWECDYPGFAAAPTGGQVARASCGSCLRVGNIIKPVYGKLDHNPSCNSSQSYS